MAYGMKLRFRKTFGTRGCYRNREDTGLGSDVGMSILCVVGHGGEGRLWVSHVVKESLAL